MRFNFLILFALLAVLGLGACGKGEDTGGQQASSDTSAAQEQTATGANEGGAGNE
jgi:hypothetical protein